ncbi:hypothetical protein [uncultured Thiohalocapsa sp.]|jgi:hypothetical protein|nr:hypothetical protein [uncultured Thiohalocapsa sp.]
MHPYIAYLILTNPANHRARPDECCTGVRDLLGQLRRRWLAGRGGRR